MPVPVGLMLSGGLVWHASQAAFSGRTTNSGVSWTAGSINLTNDSGGQPLFNLSNITPGDTGSRCIAITSEATVPTSIKLYTSTSNAPSNDISPYLDITVEDGTGGSFDSCDGFTPSAPVDYTGTLENLTTTRTNYANGIGPWPLTGNPPETRTFRLSWTFSATAPDSTQGGSTPNVNFTWEAQAA
ncbi:hypothetical protein [Streptomyces sporangiiformans]|uniref:Uncharacterized protein n=1 Tax=Streptomyces sporangiiformans TaxID=2315329 RepID=A0A505D189_9ACTN|nr:hypothetical protein [Streptomyces sporangiiformans]TPQ16527.1 hypothetical protein FGD71_041340 [Streptomyces sporangiiformans]